MKNPLRFRQVHLDFHTSPAIPGIGVAFDKAGFQDALRTGHVDSITVFSKCHHGYSYHPTQAGRQHPHLTFDLLRAQMDACREINVNTPVYISAGIDNAISAEHPEWRVLRSNGQYAGWVCDVIQPGFHRMCFNSPYLDYLCAQIREVVTNYPDAHGIFLDIISEEDCCCKWCVEWMEARGLDAADPAARKQAAVHTLRNYYERSTAACRSVDPSMPVFHNAGHITPGDRAILPFFSHLELESLPTGGWGYDHFPMSAKYVNSLGLDYLGMTGKFHTSWGEFGGFKHPNALRYECAAMLAYGSKCSVGDQLHPSGKMDASTYELIGAAYAEVEAKEPWCGNVTNVADIGLLLSASLRQDGNRHTHDDTGANRLLLEGHFLYDVLDAECDFAKYRLIIIPDTVRIDETLKQKLDAYLAAGGKLFLSGNAGLSDCGTRFLFDTGATCHGTSPFSPDFILPAPGLQPGFVKTPFVAYYPSQRIRATDGQSLGAVYDPYFNRTWQHFCSHQHTPNRPDPSGFDCGVLKGNILYLAHPVFSLYNDYGAVACQQYIHAAIRLLLGVPTLAVNGLPSTGRVTLADQPSENRLVLHLLHANTILRGARGGPGGGPVEVIQDLTPLAGVTVLLGNLPRPVKSARLVPQNIPLELNGGTLAIPGFTCHQMVELS